MKTKKITFHKSYPFSTKPRELKSVEDQLQYLLWSVRESAVPGKRVRTHSDVSANNGDVAVSVGFEPSVEITKDLVEMVAAAAGKYGAHLDINPWSRDPYFEGGDLTGITPSGLQHLRTEWNYSTRWYGPNSDFAGKKLYAVQFKFFGKPDETQKSKLCELADSVYSSGDREVMRFFGIGMSSKVIFWESSDKGAYPETAVEKIFEGDITKQAENVIAQFYRRICDFLLEQAICERCPSDRGNMLGEELKSRKGIDTADHLLNSTLSRRFEYSPTIGVTAIQPTGNSRFYSVRVRGDLPSQQVGRYEEAVVLNLDEFGVHPSFRQRQK